MHFRTIARAAATAVGGALLVTACSSGGGTAQPSDSPISARPGAADFGTHAQAPDACALITGSEASALFGRPATNNATASVGDGVCAWNALENLPDGAILRYSLVAHVYNGTSAYTEPKLRGGHRVAVGERAYAYKVGSNTDTIEAVDHNKTVVLIYAVHAATGGRVPSMPGQTAKLTALARVAASRL